MTHRTMRLGGLMTAFILSGVACAQTTPITETSAPTTAVESATGQSRVAGKVSVPFTTLAGSSKNAVALAKALRTGTPVTLNYASTTPSGGTTTTATTITPPTKPMGWGNVSHSLALAQFSLTQAGITNPTGAELQAALLGGTVTAADGNSVSMAGVLQQRASGMGWGEIAQSYGTTMGAINRDIKVQQLATGTPSPTMPAPGAGGTEPKPSTPGMADAKAGTKTITAGGTTSTSHASKGVTTAGDTAAGAKGITTAAGGSPRSSHASKGLTTASGTAASTHGSNGLATASGPTSGAGVVNAGGGNATSHAYGRGIVTATGSSAAISAGHARGASAAAVTASGHSAGGIVRAQPEGNGQGHGKGKGG